MAVFSKWYLTDAFLERLTQAQTSEAKVDFKRVLLLEKTMTVEAIRQLTATDLAAMRVKMTAPAHDLRVHKNQVSLRADFTSLENMGDSFAIGSAVLTALFAGVEFIVAVAVSKDNSSIMPERTESITYTFRPKLTLTDANLVMASESATLASFDDLEILKEEFSKKADFLSEAIDEQQDRLAKLDGRVVTVDHNQTITGTKTFTQPITGSVTGKATTADRLTTARTISLTGDVTGSVSFNGAGNVSIPTKVTSANKATTADKLTTPRTITLTGNTTGSVSFDGSGNVSLATTTNKATTADRLTTARTISLTGDVTGSVSFNGANNVNIATKVAQDVSVNFITVTLTANGHSAKIGYRYLSRYRRVDVMFTGMLFPRPYVLPGIVISNSYPMANWCTSFATPLGTTGVMSVNSNNRLSITSNATEFEPVNLQFSYYLD